MRSGYEAWPAIECLSVSLEKVSMSALYNYNIGNYLVIKKAMLQLATGENCTAHNEQSEWIDQHCPLVPRLPRTRDCEHWRGVDVTRCKSGRVDVLSGCLRKERRGVTIASAILLAAKPRSTSRGRSRS